MTFPRDCHIEFTGDTLKMPISDDLMGMGLSRWHYFMAQSMDVFNEDL